MEDDARIEKEVRLCEERVQAVVDDPAIQILMKNMNERGCGMNLKNFICKPCESTTIQGGYQLKPDGQAQEGGLVLESSAGQPAHSRHSRS
eukprot:TRINITY_DN9910_c0_g1_i6.p1 TRINITY_DN9910_c0_g1~~TRINITY_DN9910_c0_g1_i6.p1  ORF type:complete len:101 (-),score=15.77 TRINITY_DN9910_c0_g1_i6:144-416(-)